MSVKTLAVLIRSMCVVVLILLFSFLAHAEQKAFAYEINTKNWPLSLHQGSKIVLKIPTALWQVENDQRAEFKLWSPFKDERGTTGDGTAYFVDMKQLLDIPTWRTSGFPLCGEFTLTKVFGIKSATMHHPLPYTEVELQSGPVFLRLHFAHASTEVDLLNAELLKVVDAGNWAEFERSDEFRKNVFAVQESKIFTGPLSKVSEGMKISLMRMLCQGRNTFSTEDFKGKAYFAVAMNSDGTVYNSNRLGSAARVAKVINQRIVPRVKLFEHPTQESGIDGLKFTVPIEHRNFADNLPTKEDKLDIYLPLDAILKFLESDITNQQLMDASVIRLNGDRIQVQLNVD